MSAASPSKRPDESPASKDARVEEIHATLRQRILNDGYYPGQKLSENALAKEFGCSRTPVREALKRLEHENLTEVRPQSGTYVRVLSGKDEAELLEVRAYLEGLAFRLAVDRADEAKVAELESIMGEMDEAVASSPIDMARYAELHYRFHRGIVMLAGSDLLALSFERLNLRATHMFLRNMNAESAARTQDEHRRILRHLEERDPRGEKFVIDHLWRRKLFLSR